MSEPTKKKTRSTEVGKALPKKEAEKVKKITQSEMDKAFEDFKNMPTLEELAKELGVTVEDLDNM